jgi:16S rRNA (uracil1498-N3)-methyltransferase
MRLHRFFVEENLNEGNEAIVSDESLVHQLRNVFRLKTGDSLILFNNSGSEFVATIKSFDKNSLTLHIDSSQMPNVESDKKIFLGTAIPKKDKFEWVLEKGTEIGVSGFIPIISERTEKKNIDVLRSQKIIKEAAEQSERVMLPTVTETI